MYQMKFGSLIFASLTAACVAFSAFAQGLPKAGQPEDVGFSSGRLKRIASVFQGEVDKGVIPGAVILIARDGKVADFEAIGFQDREKKIPMGADSIFRIASMSKPITSVALMMLVEEGKIQLENPLSDYLPEFKGGQVGVEKVNGDGKTGIVSRTREARNDDSGPSPSHLRAHVRLPRQVARQAGLSRHQAR
jgi:CubicO group peptidase (beta-lactamase class C family)